MKRPSIALLLLVTACAAEDLPPVEDTEAALTLNPSGTITASPYHQTMPAGVSALSTITWSTRLLATAEVWESVDGGAEFRIASGRSGSVSITATEGNYYVFRLYQSTTHTIVLAETAVTTGLNGPYFGMNYWPHGFGPEVLTNANWPAQRASVAADLDQIASLGGQTIRLMIWPEMSGYTLNGNLGGGTIGGSLGEIAGNLPDLLSLAQARNLSVIIAFANDYISVNPQGGPPVWTQSYSTVDPFITDSVTWMTAIVHAVETSSQRMTVIAYDLQNEYTAGTQGIEFYLAGVFDRSHVPGGKRALSVLRASVDTQDAATELASIAGPNLGHRHLEYIDFHSFPGGYDPTPATAYTAVHTYFADSTVIMGEFGASAATSADEASQVSAVASLVASVQTAPVPMYLQSMLYDDTPRASTHFGAAYTANQPKDVLGWYATKFGNLVLNGDFETTPVHWSAGGSVAPAFALMGPLASDAATGNWYGRVITTTASSVWLSSDAFAVTGGKRLYVDAYLRSNLAWTSVDVHEYDASGSPLRTTQGPQLVPGPWGWQDYLGAVGSFSVPLLSNTRSVIIAPAGQTSATQQFPAYLDVDAVSVWTR